MAAASTFSYAQAAKGQGVTKAPAPAPVSESNMHDAASEPGTGDRSAATASSVDMSDTTLDTAPLSVTHEKQDLDNVSAVESESRTESVPERSPEQRRDDDTRRLDRPWRRSDKGTRSSSAATRSVDDHESRRTRKPKKGKPTDKSNGNSPAAAADESSKAEEIPKVELSEAPIPSVNIWQQRKEAQQAKVKPSEASSQLHADNHSTQGSAATSIATGDSVATSAAAANGSKSSQKSVDTTKPERQASRGSRAAVREAKTDVPPSVNDASSWPTPETSIQEDKRKPSVTEKGDRVEKDGQDEAKPRPKKEWVTYDYVPSVSFETQMPQIRGSKARGGAKGAASSRTSAASATQQSHEKANVTVPSAKNVENKERAREPHSSANGTSTAPQQPKRTSSDAAPQTQPRGEQKKPAVTAATDKPKEGQTSHYSEHGPSHREGRSERGRGGYRGRGGHHGIHTHSQHQHQHGTSMAAPQFSTQGGAMGSRSQVPYSPPLRQGGHNQIYMSPNQRGNRGGRNNASNFHRMSLPNGTARPPPVETQFTPYYPVPPMSAVPYQQVPYWDSMVVAMVRNQIEYYFSIENLCKDMYLRKRMDSQGFVPLMFVTAFKRMRELSPDIPLVRSVCEESTEIDYVVGEDDIERLRRRTGWQSFVLPLQDRDELARNAGPIQLTFKNRSYVFAPHINGLDPQGITSPPVYHPHAFVDEQYMPNGINGHSNSNGGSQLSAEVPDFSPSHPKGEQPTAASLDSTDSQGHVVPATSLPNGTPAQ